MEYVFCTRQKKGSGFGNEPGATRYLEVPESAATIQISHENKSPAKWLKKVLDEAETTINPLTNKPNGDILVYVHGFNTSQETVLRRHRLLKTGLAKQGFKGVVVSFDWPSADVALNYLEDRSDARATAEKLVSDGIVPFSNAQKEGCEINVHVLAHSMGAFVARQAMDHADDMRSVAATNWSVSQMMLISGDISASSMKDGHSKSSSLYRHSIRVTNYYNPFDNVLKLSNVKRVGVSPRLGRVGLPEDRPQKAVNVNCGSYFDAHRGDFTQSRSPAHNWYFFDDRFMADMHQTILGDIDRNLIPGRERGDDGELHLVSEGAGSSRSRVRTGRLPQIDR